MLIDFPLKNGNVFVKFSCKNVEFLIKIRVSSIHVDLSFLIGSAGPSGHASLSLFTYICSKFNGFLYSSQVGNVTIFIVYTFIFENILFENGNVFLEFSLKFLIYLELFC